MGISIQIKGKPKQLCQEMIAQGTTQNTPKTNVPVTNPTCLAIASTVVGTGHKKRVIPILGLEISSTKVSGASKLLDEELEKWRNRPIGRIKYLQLDARYEKIRQDGMALSCAVSIVNGVMEDGKRTVLGTGVSLSEKEVHWRNFLLDLRKFKWECR